MPRKSGIGRGLDALFIDNATDDNKGTILRISEIEPNKLQPRREFDEDALNELSQSIKTHGVLQPILVRPIKGGTYQIVAGERRWRAARLAELSEIPVIIKELSDSEVMLLALIENLQREDLNPIEEAQGYQTLMKSHSLTQEQVAEQVGKSRPAVTNALRLLSLPSDIIMMINDGEISAGHGRALLAFSDGDAQYQAAKKAAAGASVRETERLASVSKSSSKKTKEARENTFYKEVELTLKESLGRKVKISAEKKGGTLHIDFYSEDDLKNMINNIWKED